MTTVIRITIDANLEKNIKQECDIRLLAGAPLAASFVLDGLNDADPKGEVILIFQAPASGPGPIQG